MANPPPALTRAQMIVAAHEEAEMLSYLRGPGDSTLLSTHTVDRVVALLRAIDAALTAEGETPAALVDLVLEWQAAAAPYKPVLGGRRYEGGPMERFCDAEAALLAWTPAAPGEAERAEPLERPVIEVGDWVEYVGASGPTAITSTADAWSCNVPPGSPCRPAFRSVRKRNGTVWEMPGLRYAAERAEPQEGTP